MYYSAFAPWWCEDCDSLIPASALTHWNPEGQRHSLRPPGAHQPDDIRIDRVTREEWVENPDTPAGVQWSPPGRYITATDQNGTILTAIRIVATHHRDGTEDPMIAELLEAALRLAYTTIDGR